jgi:hypothetical protein
MLKQTNMKQKLKKFLLLSLLTGTLFVSCELQEDYHSKKEYEGKMKISHKNFSELLNDRKFNKAYGEVLQKKNIMSRTVMEDQYQFTIANGLANVIETDSDVTYTLLIKRDSIEENTIENLIVKIDSLSETTAYIVKFKGKLGAIPSYNNLNDDTIEKVVTPIVYNSNIASKEIYECYEISYWVCYYPGHTDTGVCTHGEYETMEFCEVVGYDFGNDNIVIIGDGGGGSGGSSSSDSNYNGTDGSIHGSDSATPINMAPILELEEEVEDDPCESLKNLSKPDKYNINPIIDSLKNKVRNQVKKEWGTEFIRESYYDAIADANVINYSTNFREGSNYEITLTAGEEYNSQGHLIRYLGGIHSHPIDGYSMFSWGDLRSLLLMYDNMLSNSYKPEVSLLLVCYNHADPSNPHVYAIKVENIEALRNKINEEWNKAAYNGITDDAKKVLRINDKSSKQYEANKNDLERFFLQNYNDFGISLYKAEDNMSNWNKKSLGSGSGSSQTIDNTPCTL